MSEFDRLAGELEAGLESLVASTLGRLRERVPAWTLQSTFSPGEVNEFVRASLKVQLRAFRRGAMPESPPEVDVAAAQTVAKAGELKALLNGYWAAQVSLWEAWLDLVERSEAEPRRELLDRGSDFFFRYAGLLGDYVADAYQAELRRAAHNGEERRFQAVRGLLEGDPRGASALDLEPEQHHLGLIAWGEEGKEAARQLAAALGRRLLIVGPLNRTWWGWISGARPLDAREEREIGHFQPPAGARLAIGLQGFGEAGFRATHRQAQRARWATHSLDPPLVRYADVAVESLAGENRAEARAFVERELRGIGDDSASSGRIRETLLVYFAAGYNAASAAARLGVHEQTVANRLRSAEERLGHPVGARRVELEVALRLRAALARDES